MRRTCGRRQGSSWRPPRHPRMRRRPSYRLVPGWAPPPAAPSRGARCPDMTIDAAGRLFVFRRAEPPIVELDPDGQGAQDVGREDVRLAARHSRRSRRLSLDHRRPRIATAGASRSSRSRATAQLVMTLGTKGVAGEGPDIFNGPCDVAVAENGDIFVADGHWNARIVKFSKDGAVHQGLGQEGHRPRRIRRAAHARDRQARPAAGRRSLEQAHPDLRPGRPLSRPSGRTWARRAACSSRRRHALRRGLQRSQGDLHRQRRDRRASARNSTMPWPSRWRSMRRATSTSARPCLARRSPGSPAATSSGSSPASHDAASALVPRGSGRPLSRRASAPA